MGSAEACQGASLTTSGMLARWVCDAHGDAAHSVTCEQGRADPSTNQTQGTPLSLCHPLCS